MLTNKSSNGIIFKPNQTKPNQTKPNQTNVFVWNLTNKKLNNFSNQH